MSDQTQEKWTEERRRDRSSPSLFGPLVLIAIGVYFLLYNLSLVSSVDWLAALRLWPLLLVFLGVNIIVRQFPRPWGSLLSALVGLAAIGFFGYVLLFGAEGSFLGDFRLSDSSAAFTEQDISYSADGLTEAVIEIDFSALPANVYALEDSRDLIAGSVSYKDDLIFETSTSGQTAQVRLGTRDSSGLSWLDPSTWSATGAGEAWQLGINPDVATALRLDVGSGRVDLDLADLTLSGLTMDGGSGAVTMVLPGGTYDMRYDASSGATNLTLPSNGRPVFDIEGGSGGMILFLPRSIAARVEVDDGSGSFSLPQDRFEQISGRDPDEGVWQTEDYESATDRINLVIDVSSGSVRIENQ